MGRSLRALRLFGALVLAAVIGGATASASLAEELVTLRYDQGGRLDLVGEGWNPNDHVVILVNSKEVAVTADSAGEFVVPAPLPAPGEIGFRLSWRRDSTDLHQDAASLARLVLLPVVLVAAGLLLVVALGTLAARRMWRTRGPRG